MLIASLERLRALPRLVEVTRTLVHFGLHDLVHSVGLHKLLDEASGVLGWKADAAATPSRCGSSRARRRHRLREQRAAARVHPQVAPAPVDPRAPGQLLAALALALQAACASVGPDYRAPDAAALHVPEVWRGATTQGAADAGSLATWWRAFGDPILDGLVEATLRSSPTVGVAQARLREARARREVAGASRFPNVGASVGTARSRSGTGDSATTRSSHDASIDASWEPDLFGGQRRALEAADADLGASLEDLRDAQVSLAAETALGYVEVRSLQARVEIARANLRTQSETLQLTQWRAQAGLTSALDVEQARAGVEQTRAQIPSLESALAQARNRLAVLAGEAPGALDARLAAPGAIPAIPPALALGIPADTLRRRPDLRAAERRLAAEAARVGVAEANRYPSLSLSGSIGLEAASLSALDSGAAAGRLAARLAATIFDAGRLRAQVDIQSAAQERALRNYEATVLAALEDVENALVQLANAGRRREALAEAADAARNAALYAEQRYSAGITDFQTVLDTQRTLLSAQDNLEATRAEQALALIRLYKAVGGGWGAEDAAVAPPKG